MGRRPARNERHPRCRGDCSAAALRVLQPTGAHPPRLPCPMPSPRMSPSTSLSHPARCLLGKPPKLAPARTPSMSPGHPPRSLGPPCAPVPLPSPFPQGRPIAPCPSPLVPTGSSSPLQRSTSRSTKCRSRTPPQRRTSSSSCGRAPIRGRGLSEDTPPGSAPGRGGPWSPPMGCVNHPAPPPSGRSHPPLHAASPRGPRRGNESGTAA